MMAVANWTMLGPAGRGTVGAIAGADITARGLVATTDPRAAARTTAYQLLERLRGERSTPEHEARALLSEADQNDWPDVACVLHYALLAQVMPVGGDASTQLRAMFEAATAAADPALVALCLATEAELAAYVPDVSPQAEGGLARAVALLDEGRGSPVDRPCAYVACGQAYQARGLWELEEEMYAQASQELRCPLPAPLDRVQRLTRRVVLVNRLEVNAAWACALMELGERRTARELAQRRTDPTAEELADLPEQWQRDVAAVRYLVAAIASEPESVRLETLLNDTHRSIWSGYRSCAVLGAAIRLLDAGDRTAAAQLAEQALLGLDGNYLPTVRTFALRLAALDDPAPAGARYAQELARLRWRARLRQLASSRARLTVEQVLLENERLAQHAYVDELTGLANRHAYARQVTRLRRHRPGHAVAVLMIDVDHFKRVNDRHGHALGDDVLRRIGVLLSEHSRPCDVVARLGGDEFVLLLDLTRPLDASARGEQLVEAVAAHPWRELAPRLSITVSVGLATGPAHQVDDLLRAADAHLYRAKSGGRGRLHPAAPPLERSGPAADAAEPEPGPAP
jgi:diguanylate cyclase (GGDEF)-like protein